MSTRKPTGIQAQNIKLRANGFRWREEKHWREEISIFVHRWHLYDEQGKEWTVEDALAEIKRRAKEETKSSD